VLREVKMLIWKDLKLEWRNRYAINGIFLYVLLIVVLVYLSVEKVDFETWNALLWIILLFASINAIAKSFIGEPAGRDIYYYTLARPQAVILSKIIYNLGLMLLITVLAVSAYSLVLGFPVVYPHWYLLALFLGALGFAALFTMLAAIASRAGNSTALMAILSFPVFLPMLIILLNITRAGFVEMEMSVILKNFTLLALLEVVIVGLSLLLFPYIWRD
jgi:heme exporter protein B